MQDQLTVPHGTCQCGCGAKTRLAPQSHTKMGWIKGEPLKYISGHNTRKSPVDYLEEDRGFTTPCWIWQRSINGVGYGYKSLGTGKATNAHRWMYQQVTGPVPDHLELDHLCRVRACVNPAHLEPVTRNENMRRGASTKLTRVDVDDIRSSHAPRRALAERYGVTPGYVGELQRGMYWED